MADATELKNMVRLGTVMSVDKEKMTALSGVYVLSIVSLLSGSVYDT